MTIAAAFWPRRFPALPMAEPRLLEIASGVRLRLDCHWQRERSACPTLLLVHGLEGSSESHYMLGTAEKGWRAGFNVVRMNVRGCGQTEHLSLTLYHSGLSGDIEAVVQHLLDGEPLGELHLAGFSMGGNMVLKQAGEWGGQAPRGVRSVAAVSPALDLARCAAALERPANALYQFWFVRGLKARLRRKAKLFPHLYDARKLARVRTVREFDEIYTAPHFRFENAADYYARASALRVVARVAVPTLIITAQDDPVVPFDSFRHPALTANPQLWLLAPAHGGHAGFLGRGRNTEDRYWAENRILEFCRLHSSR